MAAPKKINLLIQEGFEHTPLGKILNWVLSAGRVIVIVTELIVIMAFLSRFWLDRELTNLNAQNAALEAQVKASANFEEEFKEAKRRLALYKQIDGLRSNSSEIIQSLALLLPADVSLTNISFAEGKFNIRGIALSENGLAGFIKALEDSDNLEEVTIRDITLGTGTDQVLRFTLAASKKGTNANGD